MVAAHSAVAGMAGVAYAVLHPGGSGVVCGQREFGELGLVGCRFAEAVLNRPEHPHARPDVLFRIEHVGASEIAGGVANFGDYETVFVGTPNWWADMPMAVYTFLESHDFTGKTVAPFVVPVVNGIAMEADGYRAYEIDAPYIAPKMVITPNDIENKW